MNKNKNTSVHKSYSIILPSDIKYRITLSERLSTYMFDENYQATKVSIFDAIKIIDKYYNGENRDLWGKVVIANRMEIIKHPDVKNTVYEQIRALAKLKMIAPRNVYKNAINEYSNKINEDEIGVLEKQVEKNLKIELKPELNTTIPEINVSGIVKGSIIENSIENNVENNVENSDENHFVENPNEPAWLKAARIAAIKASEELIKREVK
jgi:hypothetical protein